MLCIAHEALEWPPDQRFVVHFQSALRKIARLSQRESLVIRPSDDWELLGEERATLT